MRETRGDIELSESIKKNYEDDESFTRGSIMQEIHNKYKNMINIYRECENNTETLDVAQLTKAYFEIEQEGIYINSLYKMNWNLKREEERRAMRPTTMKPKSKMRADAYEEEMKRKEAMTQYKEGLNKEKYGRKSNSRNKWKFDNQDEDKLYI